MRPTRAAFPGPRHHVSGAHRVAARLEPQILLVLPARVLNRCDGARDRLGERVQVPELEQASVEGLQVERTPVANTRSAHARDPARERRVNRLADALACAEIHAGVEVAGAIFAEAAVDGERRIERRARERREERRRARARSTAVR
ncbi:MAG: hypothetical protein E6K72_11680 [Candidatus Eisenbacteria bacterium]|uniref:Uncharacterized protein n=1 Tax=Eiseniibacteriota bacterium TaxID=2212470 RepID=A0A538SFM8_UNCEI|nr:MAG: hypothetical protein E6K72_11680 [Candidatus Eisenbacteria bacterium]